MHKVWVGAVRRVDGAAVGRAKRRGVGCEGCGGCALFGGVGV